MKYIFILLFLISCSGSNKYGECVGFSDSERNPNLIYEVSVGNAIWTVLGFETIIAPILWATDYVYCPVAKKEMK